MSMKALGFRIIYNHENRTDSHFPAISALNSLDSSEGGGNGTSLTISVSSSTIPDFLADALLGDSISINGTCLTITSFVGGASSTTSSKEQPATGFKVGVAPETLRRTNLGRLTEGSKVNLERAVLASTRMGGHFVQGHVDTVATISSVTPDGNAMTFRFSPKPVPTNSESLSHTPAPSILRYVVEKAYITLDGASLTVTQVNDAENWFEIMLIAYSQEKVVMSTKKAGDEVNVEIDPVGKLVEKSVGAYLDNLLEGKGAERSGTNTGMLEKMVGKMVEEKINSLGLKR